MIPVTKSLTLLNLIFFSGFSSHLCTVFPLKNLLLTSFIYSLISGRKRKLLKRYLLLALARLAATTVEYTDFYESIFPSSMMPSLLKSFCYAYLGFTSTGISFLILVSSFLVFCFTWTISFSGFSGITFPFCFSGSYKRHYNNMLILMKSKVPLALQHT